MKKLIKKIRERLYWTDWAIVICQILLALIALAVAGLIVILILGACGVIHMEGNPGNGEDWLRVFFIYKIFGIF